MASVSLTIDYSGVEELVKKIATERLSNAAKKIADELTRLADHAMISFYDHYQPVEYKRQGGLSKTFSRYYKNAHGNIFYGGVELHPGSGTYYSDYTGESVSSEWVSALAVFSGKHGYVESFKHEIRNIPPVMDPSPYNILLKRRDEILNNIDSYVN